MKKILPLLVVSLSVGPLAYGAPYSGNGQVNMLITTDLSLDGSSNSNWFCFSGLSSAGNCKTYSGLVVIRLKDDLHGQQMYAAVLAAKTAGTTLWVWVDDTYLDPNGYCYAVQITPA